MKRLFLSCCLFSGLIFAAIPPLSSETRELYASHIAEGTVVEVDQKLVNAHGEDPEFKDWHFVAHVKVSKFVKAELYSEQEAEQIQVKYWKPAKRPHGWTGAQGQNGWMAQGDEVRLYMSKARELDTYDLLTPNGFEKLSEAQADYLNEIELEEFEQDSSDSEVFETQNSQET